MYRCYTEVERLREKEGARWEPLSPVEAVGRDEAKNTGPRLAIYGPMIFTAPYVLLLMRENPLRGQVGGGWALEIETILGPVKRCRAFRRVPFGTQKSLDLGPTPSHLPK
jgi:hypothetical protein